MRDIQPKVRTPERKAAIDRLRASMAPASLDIVDRMSKIRSQHVESNRDDEFNALVTVMQESMAGRYSDEKEYQILFVIGASHSGKSSLIERNLSLHAGFEGYATNEGIVAMPLLCMEVKSPCTLRNVAVEGLRKLGYPVKGDIKESVVWPLFLQQIQRRQIMFIFLDEAQRTAEGGNPHETQKVVNTFITLTQDEAWPIRLILAGTSQLEDLRESDDAIKNRSTILRMPSVGSPETVEALVRKIVTVHAERSLDPVMENEDFAWEDFAGRLKYSCNANFGSVIRVIRYAVRAAFTANANSVGVEQFAIAYKQITGASKTNNVFLVDDWSHLTAGMAVIVDRNETDKLVDVTKPDVPPLRGGQRRP